MPFVPSSFSYCLTSTLPPIWILLPLFSVSPIISAVLPKAITLKNCALLAFSRLSYTFSATLNFATALPFLPKVISGSFVSLAVISILFIHTHSILKIRQYIPSPVWRRYTLPWDWKGHCSLRRSPRSPSDCFLPLSALIKKRLAAAGKDGVLPRSLSLPPGIKPGVKIEAVKSGKKYKIKKPHQPGRPPKHHTRHPALCRVWIKKQFAKPCFPRRQTACIFSWHFQSIYYIILLTLQKVG